MAGPGSPGDDRGDGGLGRVLAGGDLRDRVILVLLAVILGGSGAAGYMNLNPPRPDQYTGTMARADQEDIKKWVQTELDRMTMRLDVMDRRLELIYEMRQDLAVIKEKVLRLESKLNRQQQ